MLKLGTAVTTAGVVLAMSAGALADAVLLKNGEKVKGKILKETATEITMMVNVTATIKDDLVIKKSDIEMIEKIPPDEEAWVPLAGLSLGQESLDAEDYDTVISALSNYIDRFPQSSHVPDAKLKIERFQNELKRVESGQLKIDGQWLDRGQVLNERVQIGGRILLNRMKRLASAGQAIEAMQVFEALEKHFGGSSSFPDAVLLARQILPAISVAIEDRKVQLKRRAERDKMRLKIAQGAEREQLEAIFVQERASMEAMAAAGEKSGSKWLPLAYMTEKNITTVASKVASETTRLNGLAWEKMKLSLVGAQTAQAALAARDLAGAEKALTDAKTAWPANELVLRLSAQLADAKKAAELAKAAMKAASKATPTPVPKRTP